MSENVTFIWQWARPELTDNQGFEILIWQEGEPHNGAYDAVELTKNLTQDSNGDYTFIIPMGSRNGAYFWSVVVVRFDPYLRIGQEAQPHLINISATDGGNGGGNGSGQYPDFCRDEKGKCIPGCE